MLRSEADGAANACADNDAGPQVLFGAHACDIDALKILDLLYLSDYPDPYYRRNREQLVVAVIGVVRLQGASTILIMTTFCRSPTGRPRSITSGCPKACGGSSTHTLR